MFGEFISEYRLPLIGNLQEDLLLMDVRCISIGSMFLKIESPILTPLHTSFTQYHSIESPSCFL